MIQDLKLSETLILTKTKNNNITRLECKLIVDKLWWSKENALENRVDAEILILNVLSKNNIELIWLYYDHRY